jgi:hypothetical protein
MDSCINNDEQERLSHFIRRIPPKLYVTTLPTYLSAYPSNKAHAHVPFYETTKNPHLFFFFLLLVGRDRLV